MKRWHRMMQYVRCAPFSLSRRSISLPPTAHEWLPKMAEPSNPGTNKSTERQPHIAPALVVILSTPPHLAAPAAPHNKFTPPVAPLLHHARSFGTFSACHPGVSSYETFGCGCSNGSGSTSLIVCSPALSLPPWLCIAIALLCAMRTTTLRVQDVLHHDRRPTGTDRIVAGAL